MPGPATRDDDGTPLTTRQVAALCPDVANASTVQYLARAGVLPGRKEGNRWQVRRADAQRFCDEWRARQGEAREAAATRRPARRALSRVLQGDTVAVLNLAASVVGLGAAAGGGISWVTGLLLAVVNALGAALAWAWSRLRRPSPEDVVDGPVDPVAVEVSRRAGAWALLGGVPAAALVATAAYVAVVASPLGDDDDPPGGDGNGDGGCASGEMRAWLPTEADVAAGLTLENEGAHTEDEVAVTFGDPDEAAARLAEWGWEGDVWREFYTTDRSRYLGVSVHRFRDADAAEEAVPYFAAEAAALGLDATEVDELGGAHVVAGSLGGNDAAIVYASAGPLLTRVASLAPPGADPLPGAVAVAQALLQDSGCPAP